MHSEQKSVHQDRVERFMAAAGQAVPREPVIPNVDIRRLRAKLILEEALETVKGLGFAPKVRSDRPIQHSVEAFFAHCAEVTPNLVEIIDGCCDIKVVTTGTLSACGIPDMPFQSAVDENNLAKFGPGHSFRADGKLIKPPGHKAPDIEGILKSITFPIKLQAGV